PIQALSPAYGSVMERSPVAFDQNFSGTASDFLTLLRSKGLLAPALVNPVPQAGTPQKTWQPTEATTIIAFKFSGGALVAVVRRARHSLLREHVGQKAAARVERRRSGIDRVAGARYRCGIRHFHGRRGSQREDLSADQDCLARRHHHFAGEQNRRRVQGNG